MTTIAVAIAVEVDDRLDTAEAAEYVHDVIAGAFTSPTQLLAYCYHPDSEVLFHEDGPCPPIGACDMCGRTGWLLDQTYGRTAVIGELVQRCDTCERFPGDLEAAIAYAKKIGGAAHAIGDGETMAPLSDAWVVAAVRGEFPDPEHVIWHDTADTLHDDNRRFPRYFPPDET